MKDNNLTINVEDSQYSDEASWMDVRTSDVVLTPLTCASLVNEILKGLLYQKCQIPYPYSWLQQIVTKKRQSPDGSASRPNVNVLNHFRTVSMAYDKLEKAMKSLGEEFAKHEERIKEVVIIFGTTPQTPKEVVTIRVSRMATGHCERNHVVHNSKYQQKILRTIFLSQRWLDSIDTSMSCTNTYIFLKKHDSDTVKTCNGEGHFVSTRPLTFHPKLKHIKISLVPDEAKANCCDNLLIYGNTREEINIVSEETVNKDEVWYQFNDLIKGFKDCYINKVSASELW